MSDLIVEATGVRKIYHGGTDVEALKGVDVEIPLKIFTDAELRALGVMKSDGGIAITEKPQLPYKPMRAASDSQKRRFFDEFPETAIAIHWQPYVVVAPGVDKRATGSREAIRGAIERVYMQ
jgi:hypothetical protein